jgi:hypothetical protein
VSCILGWGGVLSSQVAVKESFLPRCGEGVQFEGSLRAGGHLRAGGQEGKSAFEGSRRAAAVVHAANGYVECSFPGNSLGFGSTGFHVPLAWCRATATLK